MTNQTRQQRRASERRTKKQGSTIVTIATPAVDPFILPILNDHNIKVFRDHHGVKTHDDVHQAMETRALLAAAHDALLAPMFDQLDYRDTLDGMEMAIDTLDAVITPTEEALSDGFVDEWVYEVIDGECRVRYAPREIGRS